MPQILIYKAEKEVEGLEDKIAKSSVLSYLVPLEKCSSDDLCKSIKSLPDIKLDNDKALASINDSDLYYTKSILVTTNWNKNDDVFTNKQTWAARHTPSHKPTNIEHDESKVVGHITECYGVMDDGEIIPDNSSADELPNKYHLLNGAVIYRGWRDENLVARANELIDSIEAGTKYVSMECAFSDFDYAVLNENGEYSVVARDETSAFLTKHLRAYGGEGVFNGRKIGRLLKNITFTGKGYVDKPANPESVIFSNASENIECNFNNSTSENVENLKLGVISNIEKNKKEISMATELKLEDMQKKLDEVTAALQASIAEKKELADKLASINVEQSQAKITDLETQLESANTQLTQYKTSSEELQTKVAALQTKVDEMTKAQLVSSRVATLVEGGLDKDTASKKVDLYINLTDEQFSDIATELAEAKKCKSEKMTDKKDEKTKCADETETEDKNADASVLDKAEVKDELNLATGSEKEVDETEDTRKELQSALASLLGVKLEDSTEDNQE